MALFSDMMEEADDLKNEIARLRREIERLQARCESYKTQMTWQAAEIERLTLAVLAKES